MELRSSTGTATIGDGAQSQVFYVGAECWNLCVTGTASTATLTLKWCNTSNGTFVDYVYDKAGVITTYTISATQVASTSKGFCDLIATTGVYFKLVDDGAGTGTSWQVSINGTFVHGL